MAETEGAEFQRKVALAFYSALLIAGIVVYWAWGMMYDTWYPFTKGNIAIYVVYVPLILFGLIGIMMNRKKVLHQA